MKRYYRLPMKKLSDQITWFQNNALRLLQEYWGRFLLALVAITVVSLLIIWTSDIKTYERFDLTLKTIGGLFLIIGLVIAAWRSMIAECQASSMERQASSMERQVSSMERQVSSMEGQVSSMAKGQYSDRFTKAVEQIASDQLAIRLGGLASIEALSKETESEFIRVWTYLGEFLRYPPELAQWRNEPKTGETKEEQKEPLGQRPDIATVATMLRKSNKNAQLFSANLQGANLQGANLFSANLQGVNLQDAKLQDADLFFTELQGANLHGAELQGAILHGAELQGAILQGANLLGVFLQEKELQQLFSKDHGPLLQNALFSLAVLKEALRIKVSMPEKMSDVYYDSSDGPLPDDWPDYRPQPITYAEWLKKKKNY